MSLDPQTEPVLKALAAGRLANPNPPIAEMRRNYDAMRTMGFGPICEVSRTEDIEVAGAAGPLRARLYRPSGNGRGLFLHVHGGGFIMGSIEGYDKESRAFAALGDCTVLTFDYRLAPEHPFPAGLDDVNAV